MFQQLLICIEMMFNDIVYMSLSLSLRNKGVDQQVMRFAPFITPKNLQTIKNAPKTVFDNQE